MASPAETERRVTVAEYMALDDDQRYQLVDGDLVMSASPNRGHQRVVTRLCAALDGWVEANGLGVTLVAPVDVVLSDHTVLQPDLLFVRADRWSSVDDGHGITGAPDLVVEVLSPSTARRDRSVKRDLYLRAGVPWMLIVDTDARLAEFFGLNAAHTTYEIVRVRGGDEPLSLDEVVPGFEVVLGTLWFDPERFAPE